MKSIFFAAAASFISLIGPASADYKFRLPLIHLFERGAVLEAAVFAGGATFNHSFSRGHLLAYFRGPRMDIELVCDLGDVMDPSSPPVSDAWCEPFFGRLAEIDMNRFVSAWEARNCTLSMLRLNPQTAEVFAELGVDSELGSLMIFSMVEQGFAEPDLEAEVIRIRTNSCQ